MMPARRYARFAAALALCGATWACQADPPDTLTAEPDHPPPPAAVAEPAGELAEALAMAPLAPPSVARAEPLEPAQPKLQVLVSDLPATDPDKRLLVGYERLGKGRNPERIAVNTDRNGVEFPRSVTRAKIRGVPVAAEVGAGKGRAMSLQLRLEEQKTEYAACLGPDRCGCEDVKPYAYISVSHALPAGTRLDELEALSFWVRSAEPFHLHVVLSCFIEQRPLSTVAPFDGYLDADHTRMNPCWHSPRVELELPEPIAIRGDDGWHRYQVAIAGLPPSEPVDLQSGGQMVCTLDKVREIAYVLKKEQPPQPGEYPKPEGVVYFDDLEGLGAAAPAPPTVAQP